MDNHQNFTQQIPTRILRVNHRCGFAILQNVCLHHGSNRIYNKSAFEYSRARLLSSVVAITSAFRQ